MKERLITLGLLPIMLIAPALLTGCISIDRSLVVDDFVASLTELNNQAMTELSAELTDYDEQIAHLEEKENALLEITNEINLAIAYVDEQVNNEKLETGAWWEFQLPAEEFSSYDNEYYSLNNFEAFWLADMDEGVWDITKDIVVTDRESGSEGAPEVLKEALDASKSQFVGRRAAKLDEKETANQVLADALDQQDTWDVRRIDSGTYEISGYGLGYTNQLSISEWYYYEESGDVEPRSSAGIGLRDAITGKS